MDSLLRLARTLFNSLVILACIIVGLTAWVAQSDRDRHMRFIPSALHASAISYQKEQAKGFGPGANESGAIVYPLPAAVVRQIDRQRMAFFVALGPEWSGWKPTPVALGNDWGPDPGSASYVSSSSPVTIYLSRYPDGTDISPAIRDAIDDAILHPGSYYAFRPGGGLIIVTPARGEAYFVYSG